MVMDSVVGEVYYDRPVASVCKNMLSHKPRPGSADFPMNELPPQCPSQGSSRDAIGYLRNVDDFEFVDKLGEGFFGYNTSHSTCSLAPCAQFTHL